jgi:phosphinothricin acetyltransferase
MQIREAVEADFEEIISIYNEVVLSSTATFNDRPATKQERMLWWKSRQEQGYPVLVAIVGQCVVGFASFGDFRPWPGYRFTVEGTVYIGSRCRREGIGTELLNALVAQARYLGKHVMMAGVDAENVPSLRFLEKFGFERVGHLHEVGYKFDRFLDLIFLQYWLTPSSR